MRLSTVQLQLTGWLVSEQSAESVLLSSERLCMAVVEMLARGDAAQLTVMDPEDSCCPQLLQMIASHCRYCTAQHVGS